MRLFSLQAALGIANLIVMAMMETGMTQAEARQRIWMYDKYGLLIKVSVCHTEVNDHNMHYMSVWLPVWFDVKEVLYFFIDLLLLLHCMWLQNRPQEMDTNQEGFIHDSPGDVQSFLDAVNTIKPTAIIGEKLLNFFV